MTFPQLSRKIQLTLLTLTVSVEANHIRDTSLRSRGQRLNAHETRANALDMAPTPNPPMNLPAYICPTLKRV